MKTVNYYPNGNVFVRLWRTIYTIVVIIVRFMTGKKRPERIVVNGRGFRSISGIDCTVYICSPNKSTTPEMIYNRARNKDREGIIALGTIQGIAYEDAIAENKTPRVSGTIVSTIFDRSIKEKVDKLFDLHVVAQNEYGIFAGMKIHNVKVIACALAVSVDDMVMEEVFTYIADSMIHWLPITSK